MSEPKIVTAGLSWAWSALFAGYDGAAGWSIKYYFWPEAGEQADKFEIDAVHVAGDEWSVAVDAAQTGNKAHGRYNWRAIATNGTEKAEAARGWIRVAPDPTGDPVDGRSHAEIVLAAIEAVIERRATSSQKKLDIEGTSLEHFSPAELVKLRNQYTTEVDRIRQARAGRGRGIGQKISTRFG